MATLHRKCWLSQMVSGLWTIPTMNFSHLELNSTFTVTVGWCQFEPWAFTSTMYFFFQMAGSPRSLYSCSSHENSPHASYGSLADSDGSFDLDPAAMMNGSLGTSEAARAHEYAVDVRNVCKSYGTGKRKQLVLQHVNLTVSRGTM